VSDTYCPLNLGKPWPGAVRHTCGTVWNKFEVCISTAAWSCTALTQRSSPCPRAFTAIPAAKSKYSLPVASYTLEPCPRMITRSDGLPYVCRTYLASSATTWALSFSTPERSAAGDGACEAAALDRVVACTTRRFYLPRCEWLVILWAMRVRNKDRSESELKQCTIWSHWGSQANNSLDHRRIHVRRIYWFHQVQ